MYVIQTQEELRLSAQISESIIPSSSSYPPRISWWVALAGIHGFVRRCALASVIERRMLCFSAKYWETLARDESAYVAEESGSADSHVKQMVLAHTHEMHALECVEWLPSQARWRDSTTTVLDNGTDTFIRCDKVFLVLCKWKAKIEETSTGLSCSETDTRLVLVLY
jgi:hypothetical protein